MSNDIFKFNFNKSWIKSKMSLDYLESLSEDPNTLLSLLQTLLKQYIVDYEICN